MHGLLPLPCFQAIRSRGCGALLQVRADLPQPVKKQTAFESEADHYMLHHPPATAWTAASSAAAQPADQPAQELQTQESDWNSSGAPFMNTDADFHSVCARLISLATRDEEDGIGQVDLESALQLRRVLSNQPALSLGQVFKSSLLFKP